MKLHRFTVDTCGNKWWEIDCCEYLQTLSSTVSNLGQFLVFAKIQHRFTQTIHAVIEFFFGALYELTLGSNSPQN